MPSLFELFGSINLDTRAFDGSIKSVGTKLETADAQLNKVISTSNRLGDTSSTVARRYEKLSEGIEAQRQRLIANSLAFEKGDISAKQYGNVLVSVERQAASLSSRLKDAAARAVELDETGLTHFQQQIKGAVGDLDKAHSLINLNAARPFQGLGPVLQGLGARKFGIDETILNIITVAAREAGILKVAQEGTAIATTAAAAAETEFLSASQLAAIYAKQNAVAATAAATAETECAVAATAAATAETEFSAAAGTAAVAQGAVAAESAATATAMTEAAGATTLFGVALIPLAAVAAAIAASGFALYKVYEDVVSSGYKRLALEEAIAGAMNHQLEIAGDLKKRLATESDNRNFSDFLQNHGTQDVGYARNDLQTQYDDLEKKIFAEQSKRAAYAAQPKAFLDTKDSKGNVTTAAENANKYIAAGKTDADAELEKTLSDKISAANARLDELKKAADKFTTLDYHAAQETQVKNFWAGEEAAAKQAAQVQKKAQEAAQKYRAELQTGYKYIAENFATLSGSNNPFVKIFSEGQKALEQMLEATKALSPALQRQFAAQINLRTQNNTFQQDLDNRVKAFDLRSDARQFRAGKRDDESDFQKNLQDRLDAIGFKTLRGIVGYASGGSLPTSPIFGDIKIPLGDNKEQRAIAERAIIAATQGIDPAKLTEDQRQLASTAREHEATRLEAEKADAKKLVERQTKVLEGLEKALETGNLVTFRDESGSVKSITKGSPADTAKRY